MSTGRRSRFTSTELSRLHAAISDVVNARHVSGGIQSLFTGNNNAALKGVWAEITAAANLSGRSRQSVYEAAKTHFDDSAVAGVWSARDESALALCVERYGRQWRRIGSELERRPRACRDKWRLIGAQYKSGRWSPVEDEKLLSIIRRTRTESAADTDTTLDAMTMPTADIMWTAVSALMETRSHSQCRNRYFTSLLPAIQSGGFGAVLAWTADKEDRLIEAIRTQNQAETLSDVDWQQVAHELADAFTASACQTHLRHIIRPLNVTHQTQLKDIVRALQERMTESAAQREMVWAEKRRRRIPAIQRRAPAPDASFGRDRADDNK